MFDSFWLTGFMTGFDTEGLIEEIFELLLQKYQLGLQQSMKVSEFEFDFVDELCYKYHKKGLIWVGSYLDSS